MRDPAPESLPRRLPLALLLGGCWLATVHWKLAGGTEPAAMSPGPVVTFVMIWLATLALLARPTTLLWTATGPASSSRPVEREPLLEIFPVDAGESVRTGFFAGTSLLTSSLVLLAPFALLSPLPSAAVLWMLWGMWAAALVVLGFGLCRITPMLDPRRPALTWWRLAAMGLVVVAVGGGMVWTGVQLADYEPAERAMAAFDAFSDAHPRLTFVGFALVMAVLQLLVLRKALRLHRERWFDVAW